MDKPEIHAVIRQATKWTSQRHRQFGDKTQNGQARDRGSIETRHRMDKPKTLTVLGQDTEWTNQRNRQY
jgi:hypothetical protein